MYRPLFAVKTNLLYNLLSGLNVEVEVPIGEHFSLAGEWIFPWWLWEKKQYALEILNGNLELRYWFGNHTKDNLLTGWYMGVYGGGGVYDVEWKTKDIRENLSYRLGCQVVSHTKFPRTGDWNIHLE